MIRLTRAEKPEGGIAFVAIPRSQNGPCNGGLSHFDELYHEVYVPVIRECGMTAERADHMWAASGDALNAVCRGIQRAEVVIADCSTRSADVVLKLGLAMALGKRPVVLSQRLEDIPADLRGKVRPILYDAAGLGVAGMMQELKDRLETARAEAVRGNTFVPLKEAGPEPATGSVVAVMKNRAVIETDASGYPQFCELGRADVDFARIIPDMTRWFAAGDRLSGAIVTDVKGRRRYTLLAGHGDPWPVLIARYPVGTTFTSQVVNVCDGVGAFVAVTGGINGRVPFAAALRASLTPDAHVEVQVVRVDPAARQVGLRLCGVLPHSPAPATPPAARMPPGMPAIRTRLSGCVTRAVPELHGRGGFLLLRLKGYEKGPRAILHWKHMSQERRENLNDSDVDLIDEEIMVEVIKVGPSRKRIELREPPEFREPAEPDQEAAERSAVAARQVSMCVQPALKAPPRYPPGPAQSFDNCSSVRASQPR
jgi:hypothetical protein